MKETIEVTSIEFEEMEDRLEVGRYPYSGLFLSKENKLGDTDLVFANKDKKFVVFICPEIDFRNAVRVSDIKDTKEVEIQQNKFDGDFILEFSRILLNRK